MKRDYTGKWYSHPIMKDDPAYEVLTKETIEKMIGTRIPHQNEITFRINDRLLMRLDPEYTDPGHYELNLWSQYHTVTELSNAPMKFVMEILAHNFPNQNAVINAVLFSML